MCKVAVIGGGWHGRFHGLVSCAGGSHPDGRVLVMRPEQPHGLVVPDAVGPVVKPGEEPGAEAWLPFEPLALPVVQRVEEVDLAVGQRVAGVGRLEAGGFPLVVRSVSVWP